LQGPVGPQGPAGSTITPIVTIAANYPVSASDHTVFCNVTGGARTVTLPAAASNAGKVFFIRMVGTFGNACTVTPVDGATVVLDDGILQPRAVQVQSDGTAWWSVAKSF
jgi:hypothetical protein